MEIKDSLNKNLEGLKKCIEDIAPYEKKEDVPFELIERINNLGHFIRNCAYHLDYEERKEAQSSK